MPLFIVLVEKLLSAPFLTFLLVIYFRASLKSFFARIHTLIFKGLGVQIEASGKANNQLDAENPSKDDLLANPPNAQLMLAIPENIATRQLAVRTYGGDNEVVLAQIELIKDDLAAMQLPLAAEDTSNILIRHLAVTQLIQRAEFLYRTVFGSQISLMRNLDECGPQSEVGARKFYTSARNRSPRFYGDYSFDQWINFLKDHRVIAFEDSKYTLTTSGREFLSFITLQHLPKKTH